MDKTTLKLAVVDEQGNIIRSLPDLPAPILEALSKGETAIVTKYIGWDPQWGMCSSSCAAGSLMNDDKNRKSKHAGLLSVTLSNEINVNDHHQVFDWFMPYMSWEDRRDKGLVPGFSPRKEK